MTEVYLKVHERVFLGKATKVLALCDAELFEEKRVLQEGETTIDLSRYRRFYDGEKVTVEEAVAKIGAKKDFASANAVGEKSVKVVRESFGAGAGGAVLVEGVPTLQLYFL